MPRTTKAGSTMRARRWTASPMPEPIPTRLIPTTPIRTTGMAAWMRGLPRGTRLLMESSPIPTRRFESRTSPWQLEEAYRAVSALVESGAAVDAMLFEDDYHSLGALRALAERGVRVPEDVMVIGYGDHPYAAYLQPSLTSVSVPFGLIAEAAVALLLRRIAGDRTPPVHRLLPAELIVRESTVRPVAEPAPAP